MALNSHVYTILEPSIKLDEMKLPGAGERHTGDGFSDMSGGPEPYIKVNDYPFAPKDILKFTLDLNSKYPEVTAMLSDSQNFFTVDRFPRDGDLLNIRIQLDEAGTYKDIRMDFTILEFRGLPTSSTEKVEGGQIYNVRGIAKIPGMYTDECKSYGEGSSIDHIKAVATDLKLGLATNISETKDTMRRFCAYQTKLEMLSNTVLHSYLDDNSFQTYSIDPYYYINFVDIQKIMNAPEDIEIHQYITNKMFHERGTDPTTGAGEVESQLILTNHHLASGGNTSIERYNLINNSTKIALENGYKRKMQYFDYDGSVGKDLIEFDVESLVGDNIKDHEEALKGRRNSEVDEYNTHIKQKYVGIQSDSVHDNYKFAAINNIQNLIELDKMYLEVHLEGMNPALYRYMKVPVNIFNYGEVNGDVTESINNEKREGDFDVKADDTKNENDVNENDISSFTLDEFLSAHYIILGIKYLYDAELGYSQTLKLGRREWPARLNNI